MSVKPQIRDLLQEILDSRRTPEDACAAFPELLPEVRRRLNKYRTLESQIGALFPSSNPALLRLSSSGTPRPDAGLPQIEGYEVEAVLGHARVSSRSRQFPIREFDLGQRIGHGAAGIGPGGRVLLELVHDQV